MTPPLRPTLVMMTYRGGARLDRCLESIAAAADHFDRIILSVTAPEDSYDMTTCLEFKRTRVPHAEVLCTKRELPTLDHQAVWVTHLEETGVKATDWIYWLAYDDEVRLTASRTLSTTPVTGLSSREPPTSGRGRCGTKGRRSRSLAPATFPWRVGPHSR